MEEEEEGIDYTFEDIDGLHDEEFIIWLNNEGFIDIDDFRCEICDQTMRLRAYVHYVDRFCLRCPTCRVRRPVNNNPFFSVSRKSLRKQLQMLISFVHESSQRVTAHNLNVSEDYVGDFFHRCRLKYQEEIQNNPIVFEANTIYEVDEFLIPDVHVDGHTLDICVADIYERDTGKIIAYRVPNRSRAVLVPPICFQFPLVALFAPMNGAVTLAFHTRIPTMNTIL